MTDPRTSTALRYLALPDPPDTLWEWTVARVGPSGRIRLSDAARNALGAVDRAIPVAVKARGDALLVCPSPAAGRPRTVDARGRLYVPTWLRTNTALLVGARTADRLVVLTPTRLLDALGERLVGGQQ
jgi:hypothetical protein